MSRGYEPAPRSFGGMALLVVVGLIALPAAVHALIMLIPVVIIFGALALVFGILIGRRSIL